MAAPFAATVAASFSLGCGLFTALGSPPFVCARVIFLAVPVMIVGAAYQWIVYVRKYVDYRISHVSTDTETA